MSWDAHMYSDLDGKEVDVGGYDWNYTHNTNAMIRNAIEEMGMECPTWWLNDIRNDKGDYWCALLNGMSGKDGADLLTAVIERLSHNPIKYRAMNPSNGWGSYDTLLPLLREMRDAGNEWPSAKYYIC